MNSTSSTPSALLIGVIVVAVMFVSREVLIPLALTGILGFMLAPPVTALQRLRLPRPLAVTIVVLIAFGAIFALGRVLATQVTDLAGDLPKYQETISKKIESLRSGGGGGATLERAQVVLRQLDKEIDPVEAVEHAKAFMTSHSLSQYCNGVAKPALALARKDVDRGALEGDVLESFHKTVENLFADIAHEHWVLKREVRREREARPGGLPTTPNN